MRRGACASLVVGSLVFGSSLAGCSLQTTGALKGNLHLRAEFSDVQELVPGEEVDIADVQVGTVTSIRLDGYEALVTMAIKSDQKVPEGTTAVLSQTSLLGEQYIDLELPAHFDLRTGPWVQSGATLASSATEGIEAFVGQASDVLGALDVGDLASALQALSQGLGGRGPELNEIIVQLAQVAHAVSGQTSDLATVVDGLGQLGASVAPSSQQLGGLVDQLASSTTVLAVDRQKLIGTLTQLTRLAGDLNREVLVPHLDQVETLIADLGPVLGSLVQSQTQVEGLITGLDHFVTTIQHATYQGQLLIFLWLDGLVDDHGNILPLPRATSLSSLLAPPRGAGT
jgi:phospholipid/cholesterol/gamma-HCH transport system substrate-binding protein